MPKVSVHLLVYRTGLNRGDKFMIWKDVQTADKAAQDNADACDDGGDDK